VEGTVAKAGRNGVGETEVGKTGLSEASGSVQAAVDSDTTSKEQNKKNRYWSKPTFEFKMYPGKCLCIPASCQPDYALASSGAVGAGLTCRRLIAKRQGLGHIGAGPSLIIQV